MSDDFTITHNLIRVNPRRLKEKLKHWAICGGKRFIPHLVLTCSAGTRTQLDKYGLLVSNRVTKASSWCLLLSRLSGAAGRQRDMMRDLHNKKSERKTHVRKKLKDFIRGSGGQRIDVPVQLLNCKHIKPSLFVKCRASSWKYCFCNMKRKYFERNGLEFQRIITNNWWNSRIKRNFQKETMLVSSLLIFQQFSQCLNSFRYKVWMVWV